MFLFYNKLFRNYFQEVTMLLYFDLHWEPQFLLSILADRLWRYIYADMAHFKALFYLMWINIGKLLIKKNSDGIRTTSLFLSIFFIILGLSLLKKCLLVRIFQYSDCIRIFTLMGIIKINRRTVFNFFMVDFKQILVP